MAANKQLEVSLILTAYDRASRVINSFATKNEARLMAFSKKASAFGDKAFQSGKEFGAIGLAAAGPIGLAIKAAADYEKLNIALKTSFQGNAIEAKKAFTQINKFASATPYSLQEVMTGFIKLKNMGLQPGQEALTAYGNIASGMGKSLNDMVEAVADAATFEFERLKEFGIKASQQGNKVTFLFQGVKTTVNKNAAEIEKYLQRIGNTKFAGGIEAQSKSIYGLWSTLKDNATAMAATFGKVLVPSIQQLFNTVGPVLARMQAWAERNPKTAKTIMTIVIAVAALSLAISGAMFVFGGFAKAIAFASGASGIFLKLLKATTYQTAAQNLITKAEIAGLYAKTAATSIATAATTAYLGVMKAVNAVLAINPFILIGIAAVAAAFLIYKNWDSIKSFFIKTWAAIKAIFWKVVAWVKEWAVLFLGPVGFIIKYWDSIGPRMFNAGRNVIKSIADGIRSFISKPVELIKGMVQKIRNFLPFSPAKEGALRDIHRIRLVETISETIRPNSLVNAMRRTTAAAVIATQVAAATPAPPGTVGSHTINARNTGGAGTTIVINYSPTVNMGAGADPAAKESLEKQLKAMAPELVKLVEDTIKKNNRRNYQ
jgi:hypothetical protein